MNKKNGKKMPAAESLPGEISAEALDALIAGYRRPEDLTGPEGLLKRLTAALINRAMDAELTEHVGYEREENPRDEQSNRRNGKTTKRVRSGHGELQNEVPRIEKVHSSRR